MGVVMCDTAGDDAGISYLKSAAEAGRSTAMNNLAVAYELGTGVNRDVIEAERHYKQAIAADKNPIAMYNLAVLYMWGDAAVQNDDNICESQNIISELVGPETELEPLYILQEQVGIFVVLRNGREESVLTRKVEVEELDECLAFVKTLETYETGSVPGDEKSLDICNYSSYIS